MWRTGNFHTLLVGMWVSTATMKTTVEISQKSKITSTMQCKYPTSGICPKNWDQCTKEMPAVLCLSWYYSQQLRFGQTVCLSMGEWINNTWCTCTMEYYSSTKKNELCCLQKNEWNWKSVKCNKPDSERQIWHVLSHLQNLDPKKNDISVKWGDCFGGENQWKRIRVKEEVGMEDEYDQSTPYANMKELKGKWRSKRETERETERPRKNLRPLQAAGLY
jgi:hypothetical protein